MNKVHIIEDYFFSQDPYQYILYRKHNEGAKHNSFGTIIGYYQSLDKMLLKVIELMVRDEADNKQIDTIEDYLDVMSQMAERLITIMTI